MRLTELLGADVRDGEGEPMGTVTDVRMVQDGPNLSGFGATFAVEGLVVTPGRAGSFFGYDRVEVRGPWLLRTLFRFLHREARFVPWGDVVAIEDHRVQVARTVDEYGGVPMLEQ